MAAAVSKVPRRFHLTPVARILCTFAIKLSGCETRSRPPTFKTVTTTYQNTGTIFAANMSISPQCHINKHLSPIRIGPLPDRQQPYKDQHLYIVYVQGGSHIYISQEISKSFPRHARKKSIHSSHEMVPARTTNLESEN